MADLQLSKKINLNTAYFVVCEDTSGNRRAKVYSSAASRSGQQLICPLFSLSNFSICSKFHQVQGIQKKKRNFWNTLFDVSN